MMVKHLVLNLTRANKYYLQMLNNKLLHLNQTFTCELLINNVIHMQNE